MKISGSYHRRHNYLLGGSQSLDFVEVTMPFGKDITRSEKIGEVFTEDDITLKEVAQRKDKEKV